MRPDIQESESNHARPLAFSKALARRFGRIALVLQLSFAFSLHAGLKVTNLLCEYRQNPMGVDTLAPRLSWELDTKERGQKQVAYRILAASALELLQAGHGDLWDSGRVASDQNIQVHYAGKPLASGHHVFWKVQAWDTDGTSSGWSPVAEWEMGLLAPEDWNNAAWIRLAADTRHSPLVKRALKIQSMKEPRAVEAYPSPLFRREFRLKPGIVRARAYICGLGYAELYVNGQRIGDEVLDPGQTTYDVRAFYVVHDVTHELKSGANAVGVMVGSGFFGQNHAFGVDWLSSGAPVFLAQIIVTYADGSKEVLVTDESWKATTGAILYDNVYGGETYDARLEMDGWTKPDFDDSAWAAAARVAAPTAKLVVQSIPPIRRIRTIKPQAIIEGADGKWIFDLGQNIAGWARIHPKEFVGAQITLGFAEALSPDGKRIDFLSTGVGATGLEQTDIYVCKGKSRETWEPRFTYHGFRYIEVAGLSHKPSLDFLEGILVRTDVASRGSFSCSDEILNRIYQTSLWTIEDNLHSVSEDCPHREKCGWLGDAHCVAEMGIMNFDMAQFWMKFVDDIETTAGRGGQTYWGQKATPGIPCNIAVGKRLCEEARPDWGAAIVLLPWYLYTYYDDSDVLACHYDTMKRWISYVGSLQESNIVTRGYGDWCPPGGNQNMECPVPLSSTAYYYGTLRIMQQVASLLGKNGDTAGFSKEADDVQGAFIRNFYSSAKKGYGSQTADALALRFGLFPEGKADSVAKEMVDQIVIRHDGHAFVGIHGGHALFMELGEYGYDGVAMRALTQTTYPSYCYAVEHGSTTWPEIFNVAKADGSSATYSLNHPMQSGFAIWFQESVGGIRPLAPGFKRIEFKPHNYRDLQWAKAEHDSLYGPIKSSWRSRAGKFDWEISVPANTSAIVYVPARETASVAEGGKPADSRPGIKFLRTEDHYSVYDLGSGNYHFTSRP
jgi:alpha-L-rhamnosidase